MIELHNSILDFGNVIIAATQLLLSNSYVQLALIILLFKAIMRKL